MRPGQITTAIRNAAQPGDLQTLFEANGVERDAGGNLPLFLADAGSAWMVVDGFVDVFSVALDEGRPCGSRTHLCRVESGGLLVGHRAEARLGLIAAGKPGTRVRQAALEQLQQLTAAPETAKAFAPAVEAWIGGLTAGVVRNPPPRDMLILKAGETAKLARGAAALPARGVLWFHSSDADCELLGEPELVIARGDQPFPLASPAWVESRETSSLNGVGTDEVIAGGTLWDALDRFHSLILAAAAHNADMQSAVDRKRIEQKALHEGRLEQATIHSLAAVSEKGFEPVGRDELDPLVAACRLVGHRMGIEIVAPLLSTRGRQLNDPIMAIARASRVRSRRVLLKGNWWRVDNGPLAAFLDDDRPVALVQDAGGYHIVDPAAGTQTPVNAENAAKLQPFAYCFYRSLGLRRLASRSIFRFALAGTWADWLTVAVIGLAGSLIGLVVPIVTGILIDRVLPEHDRGQLIMIVLGLTACAVVGTVFFFVQGIAMLRLETRMDGSVEAGIWDRILNLPAPFFREYAAGELAYRVMGISAIRQALSDAVVSAVLSIVFSIVSFAMLFYYSPRLAWIAVALYAASVALTVGAALIQLRYERRTYEIRGKIGGLVLQLVAGISRLRIAAAENRALAVWLDFSRSSVDLRSGARSVANLLASVNAGVPVLAAAALFAAVLTMARDAVSIGEFLAFSAAYTQLLSAAVAASAAVTSALRVVPLYEQLRPILDVLPEGSRGGSEPGDLSGDIEVSHVSFRYSQDGPNVLDDVSVHIRPGEFVAFVGPSGAGKSTLLRLLLGFETPTTGSVYYDKEDLAGLNVQAVRRQIGVVLQNGRLTPGDILSNIIGSSLLTLDDAREAASLSGLAADIDKMPMGMHTVINEGESTLSGGQKQRLMIARAVASRPRMLFFDEATSALDNATQAQISRSLEQLKTTRVVIAHRLSTIEKADRICVMDRGRIVQQGTFESLMQEPGLFAELAKRQMV